MDQFVLLMVAQQKLEDWKCAVTIYGAVFVVKDLVPLMHM